MPIAWEELDAGAGALSWTTETVLARLSRRRRNPWARAFALSQALPSLPT